MAAQLQELARSIAPVFDGTRDSFSAWTFQFPAHLNKLGLGDRILQDGHVNHAAADRRTWDEILLAVRGDAVGVLREVAPGRGFLAWAALHRHYVGRSFARECLLQTQLLNLTFGKGTSVSAFRTEFMDLRRDLLSLGQASGIHDRVLCNVVMNVLPAHYFVVKDRYQDPLVQPEADHDFSARLVGIFDALSVLEQRIAKDDKSDVHYGLAVVHTSAGTSSHKPKCKHCGRPGHDLSNCYQKIGFPVGHPRHKQLSGSHAAFKVTTSSVSGSLKYHFAIDSACTAHMSSDKTIFSDLRPSTLKDVIVADGRPLEVTAIGDIKLTLPTSAGRREVTLSNVLLVPSLNTNLLSTKRLEDVRAPVRFTLDSSIGQRKLMFTDNNADVPLVQEDLTWIPFEGPATPAERAMAVTITPSLVVVQTRNQYQEAHERLGHVGHRSVSAVLHIEMPPGHVCLACADTKLTRVSVASSAQPKSVNRGEIIHSDMIGPFPPSLTGKRFCVTFTDEATRYTKVYLMNLKSELLACFKEYLAHVSLIDDFTVRTLHSDHAAEYTSKAMSNFCSSQRIRLQTSPPYTPERNGHAERLGRTLQESARAMLRASDLDNKYWGAAITHAALIKNVVPHSATNSVPWTLVHGKTFDLRLLHRFGAPATVHIPEVQRLKLGIRGRRAMWLGVDIGTMSHQVQLMDTGRLVASLHLAIHDSALFSTLSASTTTSTANFEAESVAQPAPEQPAQQPLPPPALAPGIQPHALVDLDLPPPAIALDAPINGLAPETRVEGAAHGQPPRVPTRVSARQLEQGPRRQYALAVKEPTTLSEVLASPQWAAALDRELEAHEVNDTWELIPRSTVPPGHKILTCSLIAKVKTGAEVPEKMRAVAGGNHQIKGLNYDETYAPAIRATSMRTLLSHAAANQMKIHTVDIKTAFLNAPLKEEVYMFPPGTVNNRDEDGNELVCRLRKSIYGLHQSPKEWNETLTNFLVNDLNFVRSRADQCIFTKNLGTNNEVILGLYVDDVIIAARNLEVITQFKIDLNNRFKLKDNGPLCSILGMKVNYDINDGSMHINLQDYTLEVLARFGMRDCKPVHTPMMTPLAKLDEAGNFVPTDKKSFQAIVGCLNYLANNTRPDIAFAVSNLSRHMADPGEHHAVAAKRVLRYLAGTPAIGLNYQRSKDVDILTVYSDADYAEDKDTRKSTTGLCLMMNGAAISWSSRRQSTVASSTAEAEYTALFSASQECAYIRQVLSDLGVKNDITTVYEDNQPAIHIASNPVTSGNSKHFDVRLHYIRDKVQSKLINIQYLATGDMVADMMTKALDRVKLEKHRSTALGMSTDM